MRPFQNFCFALRVQRRKQGAKQNVCNKRDKMSEGKEVVFCIRGGGGGGGGPKYAQKSMMGAPKWFAHR
jgi:hypothetical protein